MTTTARDARARQPLTAHQRRWLEHIQAAQTAGLSSKAYADREGLSVSAMYACKAVLRDKGYLPSANVTLVPAQIVPTPESRRRAEVCIHLPNGIVIETAAGVAVQPVVELARALR